MTTRTKISGLASLACTECRKQHLKCDASKPSCSRCVQNGLLCQYLPSRRGGRKKPRNETPYQRPSISQNQANVSVDNNLRKYFANEFLGQISVFRLRCANHSCASHTGEHTTDRQADGAKYFHRISSMACDDYGEFSSSR